jgi:hypothetical protein
MLLTLGCVFVTMLWTQSLVNGGYTDNGQFPLANSTVGYLTNIQNKSAALSNSMNATFSQSTSIDLGQGIFATGAAAGQTMSIIWSMFLMVSSMLSTIFLAPIIASTGVLQLLLAIGIAYVAGLLVLVIAGVVLKWFI